MNYLLAIMPNLNDIIDILIISYVLYKVFIFIRGTYAVQVLFGLGVILIFSLVAEKFQLRTIAWLLTNFASIWVLTFIILFQAEIRKALARIGNNEMWQKFFHADISGNAKEILLKTAVRLSKLKTGALIVIENSISLKEYAKTGVELNSDISIELLSTIFFKNTALHDGAVIISSNKILAAGCILPLSDNTGLKKTFGTRHRAGLGIAEETDSFVIIVSEETGNISVAIKGKLVSNISEDFLQELMTTHIS
ncbi:diadenylate cyclase CdaA [Candidatus Dependentiae bacterium]|nr:diadenylate cyclase CdaA [Candidatus Dependentiae bacterium]